MKLFRYSNLTFILVQLIFSLSFSAVSLTDGLVILLPVWLLLILNKQISRLITTLLPFWGMYQFWVINQSLPILILPVIFVFLTLGLINIYVLKPRLHLNYVDLTILFITLTYWLICIILKFVSQEINFYLPNQFTILVLPVYYLLFKLYPANDIIVRKSTIVGVGILFFLKSLSRLI